MILVKKLRNKHFKIFIFIPYNFYNEILREISNLYHKI